MAATLGVATLQTDVNMKGLDKGLKQSESKSKSAFSKIGDGMMMGFGMGAADAAMMAVNAVKDFAAESIAEFQQFDKQASEVFTLMPGMSQDAMDAMKGDVLSFSAEVGRTTDETLPALYQAISAGVPPDNVFDFMQIASDAALGGVTDLETAVDGITSVVNAYGAEAIDAGRASDVMFTAVKLGKTDFTQLSSSLFNVIPTAASLGVTFEDVAASMAVLTGQGTPTSVATTQLRAALVEASKGGTKLDLALRDLTGKTFAELIGEGKTASEIFNELRTSMPEQQFKDLFGSVEALNAVLGITGPNAEKTQSALDDMANAAGATAEAAETMAQTVEHLENKLEASTEAMKIQTGQALQPLKKGWLQFRLAVNENVTGMATVTSAMQDGTLSFWEGAAALDGIARGGLDAGAVLEDLEEMTQEAASADEMLAQQAEAAAAAMEAEAAALEEAETAAAANTQEIRDAAEARSEAAGINEDFNDKLMQTNNQMSESEAIVAAANAEMEAHKLALEETALQAEALAAAEEALALKTGEYFTAAMNATGGVGFFNETLDALNNTTATASLNQDSVNQAIFDSIAANGASAESLAILGGALGLYSEEAVQAALQTALIQTKIDELAAGWDGTAAGATAMQEEIANYAAELATMSETNAGSTKANKDFAGSATEAKDATDAQTETLNVLEETTARTTETSNIFTEALDVVNESTIALDGSTQAATTANTNMQTAMASTSTQAATTATDIANLTAAMDEVPLEVATEIVIPNYEEATQRLSHLIDEYYTLLDAAAQANGAVKKTPSTPGGAANQGFARGGWTGAGPSDGVAGPVHFNELVVPETAVRQGAAGIVNFANQHVPGGVGAGGGAVYHINVDARGATNPAATKQAGYAGAETALRRAGAKADQIRRMGG
jgi:TP901 family phage tail tape measure protein